MHRTQRHPRYKEFTPRIAGRALLQGSAEPTRQLIAFNFAALGLVAAGALQGCADAEISALMDAQYVTSLPASYREFLGVGGWNPYWLTHSGEWHYEWLLEAKQFAYEDVVHGGGDWELYKDAFVFQTHQGYMFYYLRPEDLGAIDPHFWIFSEAKPVRDSGIPFSVWLQELAGYLPRAIATRRSPGH